MLTLFSFLFFTSVVAVAAWWKTRDDRHNTATGYFLAGRSLAWPVIGGSLLLTNLSTEQLVGINGGGYQHGMLLMSWEVWSSLSIIAMAVIFLPRYLRSGITTVPEFLEIRFSHSVRVFTSVASLVLIVVNILPFILLSGAEFMIPVFGLGDYIGTNSKINLLVVSGLLAVVGGCYAIVGGLKAVAVSDTVNGIGLVIGGLMVPLLGLSYVGDGSIAQGLTTIVAAHPERLAPMGDSDSNIPWHSLFTGMTLLTTFYWCTNQGIVQRTFAAKNLAEGQKGTLFAAVMKLFGPIYLVLPGIIAWHIASSGAEGIMPPQDADGSYGFLVNLVLPDWATGFFAATIFGAILSSFNSFLNSGSTLFAIDIYKGVINRRATDEQAVRAGQIFGIVTVPLSVGLVIYFKLYATAGLFDLMKATGAVINIPMIAIVIVAFISKRTPAIAANVAMLFGMVFQLVFGILNENRLGFSADSPELHWLHLAGLNFAIIMLVMLVFRLIRPLNHPAEQTYSEDVDITPWRLAKPAGLGIAVVIGAMYISMWNRFGLTPGAQIAAEYKVIHSPPEPSINNVD